MKKRTMHVVLTLPVEVLDPKLSKEDVTHLVPQWIEAAVKAPHTLFRLKRGPSACTVYAVKEEKE